MLYSFQKSDPSLSAGVRRIARGQVEEAIAELDDPALEAGDAIHQVRKRCKKLRGLVRLVRPGLEAYEAENAAIRDIARGLSGLRDASVVFETLGALEQRFGETLGGSFFQDVRAGSGIPGDAPNAAGAAKRLKEARVALTELRDRTDSWKVTGKSVKVIAAGVTKTYKRTITAMEAAALSADPADFHEWRKGVKYHLYQMRLMKRMWPKGMHVRIVEARTLADELGRHHDFALFRTVMLPRLESADARTREALGALIEAEEQRLAPRCLKHGRRLFAEDADAFGERVAAYWKVWRD